MFHKYNPFTNTLRPADQISAYIPQGLGTKEATNNFFVVQQPKGLKSSGSNSQPVLSSSSAQSMSTTHGSVHASHGTVTAGHTASKATHGHHSHAAPWEGVNLWRTPYKGDTDTITQVKRSKGTLDQYVENRTRRIQQLQLLALRNKHIPTWLMMPRDKYLLIVQGAIAAYVFYEVSSRIYQHLKAKDRLKLIKLLYKDNVD